MPSVLIVSDSHGSTEELAVINSRHNADYKIHCGDSELEMDDPALKGFIKVAGNCDTDARFPEEQVSTVDNLTFFIAHGHLHQVKSNPLAIAYRAEEQHAQVVCFGHTHTAAAEKVGNQLLLNPGSVLLPRGRTEKTYIMMEWDTLNSIDVRFYTVDGEHLDEISINTSLV
ncbi:YfcE family phosphodiesterase [Lentibacillus amyloliquefaciens]|uniref:Phosphoesterase n=1 Tax=Lentibacillus amyloliquefaciens TaxID=1472767 RepID=A0A0U4FQV7_9BACI|nr:metallophosphoesterase [Lentibacillus amyloliquefaciens]ALX48229.1 metallophosphatase [Lentibacillus amyloliquefaciens]